MAEIIEFDLVPDEGIEFDLVLDEWIDVDVGVDAGDALNAVRAEAWAVGERGGVPVQPGDHTYENNSKWYAGKAKESAEEAAQSASEARISATEAAQTAERVKYYENLENKPQINSVTLVGNKFLNDLFPDGIIIDGGEAVM